MSDSEEDSQDKQLKIVVIGDGACGKVRTELEHTEVKKIRRWNGWSDFRESSLHPDGVFFSLSVTAV